MKAHLANMDWKAELDDLNVEEAWDRFTVEVNKAKKLFIPETKSTTGDRKSV